MKKRTKYTITILAIVALIIILNLLGFIRPFCNWYTRHIYPLIHSAIGHITSLCPIAVGEIIMYIGFIMVLALIIVSLLLIFLRKKTHFREGAIAYMKVCLATVLVIVLLFTTNWSIPIRSKSFSFGTRTEFTNAEYEALSDYIVVNLNQAIAEVPRDSEGHIICDYTQEEIHDLMRSFGDEFERLQGFYPDTKTAICSSILDWMGIGGYNYVYTTEPTVNMFVNDLNMPTCICHELCHSKGYYLESEAEFLSMLILSQSENPYLRYCGFLNMYYWISYDAEEMRIDELMSQFSEEEILQRGRELIAANNLQYNLDNFPDDSKVWLCASVIVADIYPSVSEQLYTDLNYAYNKSAELYEENTNEFLEETTSEVFTEVSEVGWEVQADILKSNNYNGAVLLLLQHFYQE